MATIPQNNSISIMSIKEFLGLNENPDGDTKLKMGEAAVIRNFKVTRDGNLQRRPGSDMVKGLLQTYSLVEDEAAVVRTDENVPGQLIMYPNAEARGDGFIELSGEAVAVSFDNAEEHSGYYWRYNDYNSYKLVSCIQNEAGEYVWTMQKVRCVGQETPVAGIWAGNVMERECMVAACDGKLWLVHDGADFCKEEIGDIDTSSEVFFFGSTFLTLASSSSVSSVPTPHLEARFSISFSFFASSSYFF